MRFTDLDYGEFIGLQYVLEDFVKAIEKYGERYEDGDIRILVGDEECHHDMIWITPDKMKAMKKFIKSDWI